MLDRKKFIASIKTMKRKFKAGMICLMIY